MTLTVTHTFVSAIPDDADASLVRPSNWNAAHTVAGTIDLATDITGTLPGTAGGTGQTAYAKGDILASPGPNTLNKLAVGTDGFVLTADAVSTNGIKWAALSITAAQGGTGQTTYAKGDILASPGSNTLNKLPVGTDAFVLTADAASTNGIKWAAASAGGTPAGSGTEIQYRNAGAFGAMSGTSWDNTNRSLTMTGATVTTSNPVLNMTQTWNNVAVDFSAIRLNVTNTASGGSSRLFEIQVGGTPLTYVDKTGRLWTTTATIINGSGAGIVFNNNAVTALAGIYTPAADTITFFNGSGSKECNFFISNNAVLQVGKADAAAAVAQTTQVQSVVAGTVSGTAGADWTFIGSSGTGTGAGGNIIFQTRPAGSASTSQNAAITTVKIHAFTSATVAPVLSFFNNGASGSGLSGTSTQIIFYYGFGVRAAAGSQGFSTNNEAGYGYHWTSSGDSTATIDTSILRISAGVIQFGRGSAGAPDYSGVPQAQTTQVTSVAAGTANGTAGADWTFKASSGTGTGTGGNIILKTPFSAKSSGTGQGTWVDRDIYVSKGKVLTSATPVSLFEIALPAGAMAGGTIYSTIICTNGTDMQSFSQSVSYSVVNKAGVYTKSITAATGDKSVTGASTLTTTWTLLDGTNKSTVQVSATTSLTPSTNAFICYYSMANNSEQATTIL